MSAQLAARKKQNPQPSGSDALNKDLPKRHGKALQPVSRPLRNTGLNTVIYWLAILTTLVAAFYAYRLTQWKADAGGWWNLALGHKPPAARRPHTMQSSGGSCNLDLEGHINGMASILGVQPVELASAVSAVVSQNVAPKTLLSISSSASAASGEHTAVDALLNDEGHEQDGSSPLGSIARMADAVIGYDEPLAADAV